MRAFTGRRRLRAALSGTIAATLVATCLGPAHADPAPSYAELLRQAQQGPRIIAIEADIDRAKGLAEQARARPNPTIGLLTENIAGTTPFDGFSGAETTLQYSQPFELAGKRAARIGYGDSGVALSRARGAEARSAFAYELAIAYAAVEIADRRIGLAEDEIEEAGDDLRLARALVGAGKEARLRSLQAETALDALRAELDLAQANRTAALARLSALAGVEIPYTGVSGSLLDLLQRPPTGPIEPTRTAPYRAAIAERDTARYRIAVERKRAIPDVTGTFGVRRLDRENATALVAGVSVPLPLFDRNRGNIDAANAELRGAEARAESARLLATAEIRSALAQAQAADARVAAAQESLRTAEETYRLARIAYEAGKSPLIELLTARHGLGVARGTVLDADTARFHARTSLARLEGRTITGDPIQ
jgi:cobalt-zinc-cadmium efflux system outer membrane protein